MKKKIVAMALACVLAIALGGYAMAGPVTVTVEISAAQPTIDNVALKDGGCAAPITNVDVWYSTYCLEFRVTSPNRMRQMDHIDIEFYDDAGAASQRSLYRFNINLQGIANPVWTSTDGAPYYQGDSSLASYDWNAGNHTFQLLFRLDRIARPTDTSFWHAEITAERNPANIATDDTTSFDVNKYVEINAQTNSIDFGAVDPGQALTRQDVNVTITGNIQTDIEVTGTDLTEPVDSFTIPVGSFDMERDDATGNAVLTTSAQAIYTDHYGTAEGIDANVHGYSNGYSRDVSFGGTIPDPQPTGTYTGTWQIAVNYSSYNPT